jgi:flagellar biosynthesis protein
MKHHHASGPAPDDPRAVALRYEREGGNAPLVTAQGRGELARRILALAEQHRIPVRQDADLVALLSACELGEEIPLALYEAVARLLVCLQRLNA